MNKSKIGSLHVLALVVVGLPLLTNLTTTTAWGQLKSVGKRFPADQQVSISQVDHASFDALLKKYVNDDGEVNYRAWKGSAEDRQALQQYINVLSCANPRLQASKEEKLAFWINAYNAVTLEGILEVYPTSSIRNHTKKLGYDIWKDLKFQVGSTSINLNDIEHEVLRKMNEPRIHFAIVCASIGCPRLLNQAYTAKDLETQLVTNTKDFFSRSRNLKYNSRSRRLELSAILDWFGTDFGRNQTEQIRVLSPYFPENIKTVVSRGGYSVSYQDYDWNLNTQ